MSPPPNRTILHALQCVTLASVHALPPDPRPSRRSSEAALERLGEALALVDTEVPDGELVTEALASACRLSHPVYDLIYAVLARRHGCAILTLDRRLAGLAGPMGIACL